MSVYKQPKIRTAGIPQKAGKPKSRKTGKSEKSGKSGKSEKSEKSEKGSIWNFGFRFLDEDTRKTVPDPVRSLLHIEGVGEIVCDGWLIPYSMVRTLKSH